MPDYLLAIDQGTSSSRALVYNRQLKVCGRAQVTFDQHYPEGGWVEHDPDTLWQTSIASSQRAIKLAGIMGQDLLGIGITNQRETTLVWERKTGKAIYPAIVWQDRRTADYCDKLRGEGHDTLITARTGLQLDPYFSATKLVWILNNVPNAREKAARNELCFGTVDTWLIWHLTGGQQHVTDATNASRTMLYNIHEQCWDKDLLATMNIPADMLPTVHDCCADFGTTHSDVFGAAVPIVGVAGDQQSAAIGQACIAPGMVKSTYGTGCFALMNTGPTPITSRHRLLTTVAYRLENKVSYALEGAIFMAGATIQWLRDELHAMTSATESAALAKEARDQDVILVPAFTGLGAPYWVPEARGAIFGMTRDTGQKELIRAALHSIAYQSHDLVSAMYKDTPSSPRPIRVDGGLANNDYAMQFLADILDMEVHRPTDVETTVRGAVLLAALQTGIFSSLDALSTHWHGERTFSPNIDHASRQRHLKSWKRSVEACIGVART